MQLITTFICNCNETTYSFQKIMDMPLLLNINDNNININELLRRHFSIEYVSFNTICEKCKNKTTHKKFTNISHPPCILILSLQRIDFTRNIKIDCFVKIEEIIDISNYIDQDFIKNSTKYKLVAVINHIGTTIDNGHYIAYIKCEDSNQ